MAANKNSLLNQFKKQIDENIKNGATTSKELRQGIPTSFTASDGKLYRLQNVSRYFRTSTNDKTKTLNPTFLDVELNKEVTAARANALKIQTSPNVEKWNPKTDAVEGLEAHHKRMVKMYAPFYEGLNEKQAQELTQWFVDEGVPLGDAKTNLKNLSPKVHKEIHKWMIENNIQVRPDKTGKGNFVTLDKGPGKGTSFVKGSEGVAVKAVMPSFKDLPINARFPLISNWLTYVQDPIDSKLSELEWDEYRIKHPIKPRDAAQIPEIATELAEEGKLNGVIKNGENGVNGAKKVINMERLLPIATAVSKKVKPVLQFAKPVAKYGIPLAGTVIAASNQKTIAAEYEKNPTTINRARTLNAKMQLNLEALDTATLGATGAVTWLPNLIGDVAEYGLWRTQNPQTKEEFNKELENNGGFHGTL